MRTRSLIIGLIHYCCTFASAVAWFSAIAKIVTSFCLVCCSTHCVTIGLLVIGALSGSTLLCLPDLIFYSDTYPIKTSLGVNPCIRINLPLIAGMISSKLCPHSFFADSSCFNTHLQIWLVTNCTFCSTNPTNKECMVRAKICVVLWFWKNIVISNPVKWVPLLLKMHRGKPNMGTCQEPKSLNAPSKIAFQLRMHHENNLNVSSGLVTHWSRLPWVYY